MKLSTRRSQLALLCSLLAFGGLTIYAHRGIEAAINRTTGLFRRASSGGKTMPVKTARSRTTS